MTELDAGFLLGAFVMVWNAAMLVWVSRGRAMSDGEIELARGAGSGMFWLALIFLFLSAPFDQMTKERAYLVGSATVFGFMVWVCRRCAWTR